MTEAETLYRDLLLRWPEEPMLLNDLGVILLEQHRVGEAETAIRSALRLRPDYSEAHGNLALVFERNGRFDQAEQSCREAMRLNPNHAETHFNLAALLLLTGQLSEGWQEFEYRWQTEQLKHGHGFVQPLWRGEAFAGRTLLLHAEQGYGDTLQFCRYASVLSSRGKVVLMVPEPLVGIASTLPGVALVTSRREALPPVDLQCPLLSVPLALGTTLDTIPCQVPYLHADPVRVTQWEQRLASLPDLRGGELAPVRTSRDGPDAYGSQFGKPSPGIHAAAGSATPNTPAGCSEALQIGLVWAGSARPAPQLAAIDRRRSIGLRHLMPLGTVPGCRFISLQKGPPAQQAAHPPGGMVLHDFTDDLVDFSDTAALIGALHLVISVDTAVAHLAGALGKPVWLLNRFDTCWRWLRDREDSPWYPTLRLFRQTEPGNWDDVVERVRVALQLLAAGDVTQLLPRHFRPPMH
jgi:hypothetical protein